MTTIRHRRCRAGLALLVGLAAGALLAVGAIEAAESLADQAAAVPLSA
jgi:hypothetical protein